MTKRRSPVADTPEIENLSPDKLVAGFARTRIATCIILAVAVHLLVIILTSIGYIRSQLTVGPDQPPAEAKEAEKAAKKAGKADKPPAENPACLKCHVTGWDAPDDLKGPKWDKTEGVTCEACHGAGGDYSPMKVMKDKELALQKGLVIPKKEHCRKCHNKESPTYKPFDFDTFWKKIAHDNPLTK